MLNWIKGFLFSLYALVSVWFQKVRGTKRTGVTIRKKLSITKIALKEGDQYKLGEATVTLAKFGVEGKQEVAKKIEAARLRREKRKADLTKLGEEIMLMKPEELLNFQIETWLKKRDQFKQKLKEFEITEGPTPTPTFRPQPPKERE